MDYLVTSFIEIARLASDDQLICDSGTTIGELFGDDFDDLDFELTLCAFEATHRIAFDESLWKLKPEEYQALSIEDFIERYASSTQQVREPLFVAQRFQIFRDYMLDLLNKQDEESEEISNN